MATVADLIQQELSRWTSNTNSELSTILSNPAISQNAAFILRGDADSSSRVADVLGKQLTSLKSTQPVADFYLVRPDGTIAVSTNPKAQDQSLGITLSDQPNYWGFDKLPLTGKVTALTWQPIQDQQGTSVGYLVGEYDISTLAPILSENAQGVGQTGEAYLTDQIMHQLRRCVMPTQRRCHSTNRFQTH